MVTLCTSSERLLTSEQLRSPRRPPVLLSFLATCSAGLETVLAKELQSPAVGALNVHLGNPTTNLATVHFHGDWEVGFNAILWLRCGTRILHLVTVSELNWKAVPDPIYEFMKNTVDWKRFLVLHERGGGRVRSFSIDTTVRDCSRTSSALYASNRAEAAILDSLQESGINVAEERFDSGAEVFLYLCLYKDKALLYRDMSGVNLDRRGYREVAGRESLSCGVAAGVLTIAGWNSSVPGFGTLNKSSISTASSALMDPMCGCGTFLIEAALMACNMAPGLLRTSWPFMSWHDFNEELWNECSSRAAGAKLPPPSELRLLGNDKNEAALSLCAQHAERAKVKHLLSLSCTNLNEFAPPVRPSLVAVNPPWSERLYKESRSLISTYSKLGDFLKRQCQDSDVYLLSSSREGAKQLRLKPNLRSPVTVEGLDFLLLHFYVRSST